MARNAGTVIENNLSRGLITEATGLNFPENAVTESDNVVFERIGRVRRRLGIDIESNAVTHGYNEEDGIVKEYIWKAVGDVGAIVYLVVQIGSEIHFYELSASDTLSTGIRPVHIDLKDYAVPGAQDIHLVPASITSGGGYLIVAHPLCDPVIIRWQKEDDRFESARIRILIRDTLGVEDDLEPTEEPVTLSPEHHYNLKNQSWHKKVRAGTANNELSGEDYNPANTSAGLDWTPIGG